MSRQEGNFMNIELSADCVCLANIWDSYVEARNVPRSKSDPMAAFSGKVNNIDVGLKQTYCIRDS